MEHTGTRYEATLRCRDGVEYTKIPMTWCGISEAGKTMWAVYNSWDNRCTPYFSNKYQDSELYDAGYLKVIKLDKIDVYEEREKCYEAKEC